jgi:hypothetical protein
MNEGLTDYLSLGLNDAEEARFEEDLFGGAVPAEELKWAASFVGVVRRAERTGSLSITMSRAALDDLSRSGVRILFQRVANSSDSVTTPVSTDYDLYVNQIALDSRGVSRLDMKSFRPDGTLIAHVPDLAFDPESPDLYLCCGRALASAVANGQENTVRFLSVEAGSERELVRFGLRYEVQPGM